MTYEELRVVRGVKAGLLAAAASPSPGSEGKGKGKGAAPQLKEYWGNYLFHIEDLPFVAQDCPMVFTQFRKAVESRSRVRKARSTDHAHAHTHTRRWISPGPSLRRMALAALTD